MNALILIAVCFLLGILCARFGGLPQGLPQSLNWWVLSVALPALVLNLIPRLHFNSQLWFLAVAMWFVFLGAWLLMAGLGRILGWSRGRIGALTLCAGLGIGLQFSLQLSRSQFGAVAVALGWKLVTAPLLVLLFGITVGIHGAVVAVGVLQAGMAPMISSVILADQYGLDPKVAHAALGVGILISVVTVPMFNVLV